MDLLDIVQRRPTPTPWQEGDNIPWHDPAFSRRMLDEHLNQDHDLASRRITTLMAHVDWIHETVLGQQPSSVLDLGCGPGLYCNELARRGHTCVGIDYSPASLDYAKDQAESERLSTSFELADLRVADYGGPHDLVMQVFGETNVFSPTDIATILDKAFAALRPGGTLLLEAHTLTAFTPGNEPRTWFSAPKGLYAPGPHLVLFENFWEEATKQGTTRFFVIEPNPDDVEAAPQVTAFAQSFQAYTDAEYHQLLADHGFDNTRLLPGLAHDRQVVDPNFCVLLGQRPLT